MKVALLLKRLGLNSTLMHSLGVASLGGAVSLRGPICGEVEQARSGAS